MPRCIKEKTCSDFNDEDFRCHNEIMAHACPNRSINETLVNNKQTENK